MSQFAVNRGEILPRFSTAERKASWLFSTLTRPDVIVVLGFCAIGLTLTLISLVTSPDFASTLAETANMP